MELVDADSESPTLISNIEVMQLLQKNLEDRVKANARKKNSNKRNKQVRHRDWVEEEVYRYLQGTPCVKLDPDRRQEFYSKLKASKKMMSSHSSSTTSTSTAAAPLVATKQEEGALDNQQQHEDEKDTTTAATPTGFGLTEAEALQIMNMMPTQPVEIHLMVDELHSRMSEERQEEFLEFISSYTVKDNATTATATSNMDVEEEEDDDDEAIPPKRVQTTTPTTKEEPIVNGGGGRSKKNGKGHTNENGNRASVRVKTETEEGSTGVI